MLSKSCEYGLRAVLYIAEQGKRRKAHPKSKRDKSRKKEYVDLKDLAKAGKMPYHFVSKVLQELRRAKILKSRRGARGGFAFRKNANKITVLQIVEAIDGPNIKERCFLGADKCSSLRPCPIHEQYKPVREKLLQVLSSTIESLSYDLASGRTFLRKGQGDWED